MQKLLFGLLVALAFLSTESAFAKADFRGLPRGKTKVKEFHGDVFWFCNMESSESNAKETQACKDKGSSKMQWLGCAQQEVRCESMGKAKKIVCAAQSRVNDTVDCFNTTLDCGAGYQKVNLVKEDAELFLNSNNSGDESKPASFCKLADKSSVKVDSDSAQKSDDFSSKKVNHGKTQHGKKAH